MNADKTIGHIPFHFIAKRRQSFGLSILPDRKRLDDAVAYGGKKFRRAVTQRFKHVARELSVMGPLLDNGEVVDPAKAFPNFPELRCHQSAEQRADADVGKIIAVASDFGPARTVVAMIGMVERLFHEPGE